MTKLIRLFRWLVLLIVIALLLLFAANNRQSTVIQLFPLPYEAQMPVFLVAILFFCGGILCGGAALSLKALRLHRLLLHTRHRNEALQNELSSHMHAQTAALPPAPLP